LQIITSQHVPQNGGVDLQQDHSPLVFQLFGLNGGGVHHSLLLEQLSFHKVALFLFIQQMRLELPGLVFQIFNDNLFAIDIPHLVRIEFCQFLVLISQLVAFSLDIRDVLIQLV
jgi:hypothetical protein